LILLRGTVGSGKTSVARILAELRPELKVVEVDDIKIEKYGTTVECIPSRDFPEAGRRAMSHLKRGFHAVVIEAFCDLDHINYVLAESERRLDSTDVTMIWMNCTESTAVARKESLSAGTVHEQFKRYGTRYVHPGELSIDTDNLDAEESARRILVRIPFESSL